MGGNAGILAFFKNYWEAIKQDQFLVLIILFLGLMLPLVPRYIIAPWDNYRFILLSGFPLICLGYAFFYKNDFDFRFILTDIFSLNFIILGFLSYNWAINGSLIWYPSFGWLSLFFWMFFLRSLYLKPLVKIYLPSIFLLFFCIVFFHVLIVVVINGVSTDWNFHFGYNQNFTLTYLLCLYPFFLFSNAKFSSSYILKILGLLLIFIFTFWIGVKGGIIAFLFLVIYYFKSLLPWAELYILPKIIAVFFLVIGIYLCIDHYHFLQIILEYAKESTSNNDTHRLYLLYSALKTFIENPFVGVGLGNWHLLAFQYEDMSSFSGFNSPTSFFRLGSHNLFALILAELGIIGFSSFFIPIAIIIWKGWWHSNKLNNFEKASYSSLCIYLITNLFYRDASFREFHFSTMELVAFSAMGILTINSAILSVRINFLKNLMFACSLASFLWFVFYKKTYDIHLTAIPLFKENIRERASININEYDSYREALRLSSGDPIALELLESIYKPTFKTSHLFGGDQGYGYPQSIALQIAQLYQEQGKYIEAHYYFKLAINDFPYNDYVLIKYAKFLLRILEKPDTARHYALKAYNIQSNGYDVNLLLAEIAIIEGKFDEALDYLKILERVEHLHYKELVHLLLAEISIGKKDYEKTKQYLNIFANKKEHRYMRHIKRLEKKMNF